jgi:hypothetical protein
MARQSDVDYILSHLDLDWSSLIALFSEELATEATERAIEMRDALGLTDSDTFDAVQQAVKDWADQRAAELVGKKIIDGKLIDNPDPEWSITQRVRDELHDLVNQALDEGWASGKLQDEIMSAFSFSAQRAQMIARTETAMARNQGGYLTAQLSDVVTGKQWSVAPDACEVCLGNAAQGVIALDDVFDSGDESPPAHPNCSCSLDYITGTGETDE